MSKARTLANLISDNAELADGQISVAEVVGAAPTASPTFTGNIGAAGNITNASGDLTLDVAGDIILDADGGDVRLADAGTQFARLSDGSEFTISAMGTDKNIKLAGNDGGVAITALTLDMSEAGAATFNGAVNIPGFIKHVGDDNTFFGFPSGDEFRIETGGAERISINGSATTFNEDSADKDFRVESDSNTHMLFVDAGNNRVGIGTNSLGRVFNVYDPTTDGAIKLETGGNASNIWAGIEFKTPTSQSFLYVPSNDSTGLMKFLPAASEVLALSNSAVVVNEQSSDVDFRVESNNNTHMLFVDASLDHVLFGTSGGDIGGSVDGFRINAEGNALSGISETGTFTYNYYGDRRGSNNEGIVYGLAMNGFFKSSISVLGQSNSSDNGGITLDTISGNNTKTERMRITPTEAVFNEVSTDTDFRVESDNNANMLFLDASVDRISVGSGSSMDAQLTVQNAQNNGTIGHLAGTEISNNGVRPACLEMIHPINTVSSGTVMTIPITSQGGLWVQYQVELMVVTGEYNMNTNARGGSAKFSFTSLNVVRGFVQQEVTGNISSISVTQNNANACEIRVNFSSGYTAGSSSRNGVCVYAKVLSFAPQYFELDNATLN